MLDLPTIKTDFLFKNSQDFNQTTHARPQHPTVFIHNISLYFNCISSVKYVFKWSCHGQFMPVSAVRPKHQPIKRQEKCLRKVRSVSVLLFSLLKWPLPKQDTKAILKGLFHKYFIC